MRRRLLTAVATLGLAGLSIAACHRPPLPPNVTPPRSEARLTSAPAPTPTAIGAPPNRAPETPVTRGRRFAETHCASCHAIGDNGSSPNPEAKPFRDVVKVYPPEQLQEAFAEGIAVGHAQMPPFTLNPDDADDLIAYLRTLQR